MPLAGVEQPAFLRGREFNGCIRRGGRGKFDALQLGQASAGPDLYELPVGAGAVLAQGPGDQPGGYAVERELLVG